MVAKEIDQANVDFFKSGKDLGNQNMTYLTMGGTLRYLVDDAADFLDVPKLDDVAHIQKVRAFITGLLSHLNQKAAERKLNSDPEIVALYQHVKQQIKALEPGDDIEKISTDLRTYQDLISSKTRDVKIQSMDVALELAKNLLDDYDVAQTDETISTQYQALQSAYQVALTTPDVVMENHQLCQALEDFTALLPTFKEECREYVTSLLMPIHYGAYTNFVSTDYSVVQQIQKVDLMIGQAIVPRDFVGVVEAINDLSEAVMLSTARKMTVDDARAHCESLIEFIRNYYANHNRVMPHDLANALDEVETKLQNVTTKPEIGTLFKQIDQLQPISG
ncbi:hypothetical protein EQG49_03675 [Periweissella cryptocerci]|uniref:Uncharacterized protein n=1 Tax=Periweissella cryptocerci TaxID=2506420 RepID=A0A4P6YSJ6_9LACO|nr:hypothetical protein [Periweissella cryptocerci]QBO35620.1 hypothetical protein EQG49_03675 [Periweissella cryptocerci]